MTPKKKMDEDEEEDEDDDDTIDLDEEDEDEEVEEDKFTCRVCGKETSVDEGDDMILICDKCAEKYDVDKIWNDFDNEKILEENLKSFDLAPYALNKAPKKKSSGGKKSSGKKN